MRQTFFLTIILGTFIFFNSCTCKCIKTHLTKDEKEWFSVYEKGQQIIFKSNLGKFDTLTVKDKYETYGNKGCNCYEIGTIQDHVMGIELKAKTCYNEPYCDGGISISKEAVDQKSFPVFGLFGLIYDKRFQSLFPQKEDILLSTIKNRIYHTYHVEDGVNANNGGNNYLQSFYWDKKEGLIRYDTKEGEVFELLKKTLI
mgnify:FL=1